MRPDILTIDQTKNAKSLEKGDWGKNPFQRGFSQSPKAKTVSNGLFKLIWSAAIHYCFHRSDFNRF